MHWKMRCIYPCAETHGTTWYQSTMRLWFQKGVVDFFPASPAGTACKHALHQMHIPSNLCIISLERSWSQFCKQNNIWNRNLFWFSKCLVMCVNSFFFSVSYTEMSGRDLKKRRKHWYHYLTALVKSQTPLSNIKGQHVKYLF